MASNNRAPRYHRAGTSNRNTRTPSKQQSDLLNEFSAFCPVAHLKTLKHKIMTNVIRTPAQARSFCTRVADHQRESTKNDEGDWKVAGSKKTRSRNPRRDGLSRRGRGRGRGDGGRGGRDTRSRGRSDDHRNERKESQRRDHGHSSRGHGSRSGPPRRVAGDRRPNNAAPKKAVPVAVKKPQGAWAKGKPMIVVDTPRKAKNKRVRQRPKVPPSHSALTDVSAAPGVESGWGTPDPAAASSGWAIDNGGFSPAEKPSTEPGETAAQENTDYATHQGKVDNENEVNAVVAPDSTNAWGTSATPAPASANAWSNTTEPVQQTCEEIEALQFEVALKPSEAATAEPEPNEPETFEEPAGGLEEPSVSEPAPTEEPANVVDEPAYNNYTEPEPVPAETAHSEKQLPAPPPVDSEEQQPVDSVHNLPPKMVPGHLTAPHPNDQLLPISQRSAAEQQQQQQQQQQQRAQQQRVQQYGGPMPTSAPPGMMPEQQTPNPDRMMHPSHPRGPTRSSQPPQREHRGAYPQQQNNQQFGAYPQIPGGYPAAMIGQFPPMAYPYGYAAYPYSHPAYAGMAQPPHMYAYANPAGDQRVYGGHGASRGQEDPFHRGRSGPRTEGVRQPQHHRQPQQQHSNMMDASVHPTSTPATSLPDAPAQPGAYGNWGGYAAPGTGAGYPAPGQHQYQHTPAGFYHHHHRQPQQQHVMRQQRGRHPTTQREQRGDM